LRFIFHDSGRPAPSHEENRYEMKMQLHACPAALLIVAIVAFAAAADEFDAAKLQNWHQWRGPLAGGVAPEANPPREWSESKNVRWKVEIPGKGSGSPIVWNDRVFVLTAVPTGQASEASANQSNDQPEPQGRRRRGGFGRQPAPTTPYQFTVLCFERNTGRELWRQVSAEEVPHEPGHSTNTFASGSATTDGRRLIVPFGSYGIFCYDLDGELQWKRDLGDMQTRNGFGEGASPALYEDTLVVPWDHEGQSFIAALDANTGETLWRQDRDELTTWATPLVVEHKGRVQVIANGSNRVRSYDLKSAR
jgi:outer membrane protein assembly factor BamB